MPSKKKNRGTTISLAQFQSPPPPPIETAVAGGTEPPPPHEANVHLDDTPFSMMAAECVRGAEGITGGENVEHVRRGLIALCGAVERDRAYSNGGKIRSSKRGCASSMDVMAGVAAGPRGGDVPMFMSHFTTAVRTMTQAPTQIAEDLAKAIATTADKKERLAKVRRILTTGHTEVADASGDVINTAAMNMCASNGGNNPNRQQIMKLFGTRYPSPSLLVTEFYQDWETALMLVPKYVRLL